MSIVEQDVMLIRANDSAKMLPYWDKTDAIVEGVEAVQKAAENYLPKFADETKESYENRLTLAKMTNVYRDIVESLAAKPFEAPIKIENEPATIKNILDDIDGAGNSITVFTALSFFNALNSAIHWIFIDYPNSTEIIRTVADKKSAGVRPYWSHVLGRNVFETRTEIVNGSEELTYIRILEPNASANGKDQIRIFKKSEGKVNFELYEKGEKFNVETKTYFILIDSGLISIPIIPLVPLITGRRDGRTFNIFPLLRDAADLQIDLYQQESGLKYISTLAAYPILAANGMRPTVDPITNKPMKLERGPSTVLWGAPDGNGNHGTWTYVEPSSQSMTFLQTVIEATKKDLRELGRQPLTAQSGNLTTITTAVAAGKSKSALAALTVKTADALSQALYITALWENEKAENMKVSVYDEFDDYLNGEKDLSALQSAREARDISHETYIEELKKRKVLSASVTAEKELEKLLLEMPGDGEQDLPPNNGGEKTANANG